MRISKIHRNTFIPDTAAWYNKKAKEGCDIVRTKLQGHYCKVCGEHKANEKFSGKGYNAHICKVCEHLLPTERATAMTLTRLYNLAEQHLSDSERKWLENRTHDKQSAVKELACEIYSRHFPHDENNAAKKKIQLVRVDFSVDTILCGEDWSEQPIRCRFTLDYRDGTLKMDDFDESRDSPLMHTFDKETTENLFRWMVDSLEIHCWEKDYCNEIETVVADFDLFEFLGIDKAVDSNTVCTRDDPSWSVLLTYSDGSEQLIRNDEIGLPDRVEQLYMSLHGCFFDEDEDEFSFMELALDCGDIKQLAQLLSRLLSDAEETQDDSLIALAMMELTEMKPSKEYLSQQKKQQYERHSGALACIIFLQSFLFMRFADELKEQSGKQRLEKFVDYVDKHFTKPCGELISASDLDKTMAALEKKYKLITRFSQTKRLQILRIPNSHIDFGSICNASSHESGGGRFQYELYLFSGKKDHPAPPAYILLHELGHILQTECTHDTTRIPESFCQMSDELLAVPLEQGANAIEVFADAFAIAMMQIFDWKEFDPFQTMSPVVKQTFTGYMDTLVRKLCAREMSEL